MSARKFNPARLGLVASALLCTGVAADQARQSGVLTTWKQHDAGRPNAPVVEPAASPSAPPKDAVILFDGKSLDAWQGADGSKAEWTVKDGYFEVAPGKGAIQSKEAFGDVQLHVEWASPNPVRGKGQDRGNSGIFLMNLYELQVLDSYKAPTYADGQAGAIYGQYPPLFNASKPPGEWQTYEVAFRRPRFDASGKLLQPARLTVFHNGILIQDNEELLGQTSWLKTIPYEAHADRAPISLQDHGHPVRFRNFWVRNLPDRPAPRPENLVRQEPISLTPEQLDAFTGAYSSNPKADPKPMTVVRQGGQLRVRFPFRSQDLEIVPIAPTVFDLPSTDGRFTFKQDASGKVTGLHFKVGDGERDMAKINR